MNFNDALTEAAETETLYVEAFDNADGSVWGVVYGVADEADLELFEGVEELARFEASSLLEIEEALNSRWTAGEWDFQFGDVPGGVCSALTATRR